MTQPTLLPFSQDKREQTDAPDLCATFLLALQAPPSASECHSFLLLKRVQVQIQGSEWLKRLQVEERYFIVCQVNSGLIQT